MKQRPNCGGGMHGPHARLVPRLQHERKQALKLLLDAHIYLGKKPGSLVSVARSVAENLGSLRTHANEKELQNDELKRIVRGLIEQVDEIRRTVRGLHPFVTARTSIVKISQRKKRRGKR